MYRARNGEISLSLFTCSPWSTSCRARALSTIGLRIFVYSTMFHYEKRQGHNGFSLGYPTLTVASPDLVALSRPSIARFPSGRECLSPLVMLHKLMNASALDSMLCLHSSGHTNVRHLQLLQPIPAFVVQTVVGSLLIVPAPKFLNNNPCFLTAMEPFLVSAPLFSS